MILKIHLAACVLFVLGLLGIIGLVGDPRWTSLHDVEWPLTLASPIVIWAAGAWLFQRHLGVSLAWLAASIVLMALELFAVYVDVDAIRRERLAHQETMHFAAFLALLLQWILAVVLFVAFGVVRLLDRRSRADGPP